MTCFIMIVILLWWSGTKPEISSRYVCIQYIQFIVIKQLLCAQLCSRHQETIVSKDGHIFCSNGQGI